MELVTLLLIECFFKVNIFLPHNEHVDYFNTHQKSIKLLT